MLIMCAMGFVALSCRTALAGFKLIGALALLHWFLAAALYAQSPGAAASRAAAQAGTNWSLKGDGIVCCPCQTPCPCRTNAKASYGHCEATLFLRIKQGHYENVRLDGMNVVESGGMCAIDYHPRSALYFSSSDSAGRSAAYMKLVSSLSPVPLTFPHVQAVALSVRVRDDHLFSISIPGILEMVVDRNWGLSSPPMPMVAAPDAYANLLQYVQNIRYSIHDPAAELDFDYSRRQANYRVVDVSGGQYRTKSMLIQFADGKGWFSSGQMALISAQNLTIPNLATLREQVIRLRGARGSQ